MLAKISWKTQQLLCFSSFSLLLPVSEWAAVYCESSQPQSRPRPTWPAQCRWCPGWVGSWWCTLAAASPPPSWWAQQCWSSYPQSLWSGWQLHWAPGPWEPWTQHIQHRACKQGEVRMRETILKIATFAWGAHNRPHGGHHYRGKWSIHQNQQRYFLKTNVILIEKSMEWRSQIPDILSDPPRNPPKQPVSVGLSDCGGGEDLLDTLAHRLDVQTTPNRNQVDKSVKGTNQDLCDTFNLGDIYIFPTVTHLKRARLTLVHLMLIPMLLVWSTRMLYLVLEASL